MNQASPSPAPSPEAERRVDPSMEEILASIRKIIADDESPVLRGSLRPSADALRPHPAQPAAPADDGRQPSAVTPLGAPGAASSRPMPPLFGLTRPLAAAAVIPTPSHPAPSVRPEVRTEPMRAEPASAPPFAAPEPRGAQAPQLAAVVPPSPTASATVAPSPSAARPAGPAHPVEEVVPAMQEGGALVSAETTNSVSSAFQALTASVALTAGDAIDRHVREMVRPMLRTWLDDNLPVIVEKLVRAEIERVARGGR